MKGKVFFLVLILLFAAGCSAEPETVNVDAPINADSPIISEDLVTPTPRMPNIDTAQAEPLAFCEELTSNTEFIKVAYIEDIAVENRYDMALKQSIISINGHEKITCDWECYIQIGSYDVNSDGCEELIFFIWPIMSNTGFGNVYIFDAENDVNEIFAFSGDPVWSKPQQHTYFDIPDGFIPGEPSGYHQFCIGVNIMDDQGFLFLQLVHSLRNEESVYTYIMWNHGWEVIRQDIIVMD